MNSSTIIQVNSVKQEQDDKLTGHGWSLTRFVQDLINEHGKPYSNGISLSVRDLPIIDKKILLSHLCSADDYEHYCYSFVRLEVALRDYEEEMQQLINKHLPLQKIVDKGVSTLHFIHSLIRQYGEFHSTYVSIDINDLSSKDKETLLSKFAEKCDLEWAAESVDNFDDVFSDYENVMQYAIKKECSTVFSEDMYEMSMCRAQCEDNGETYWYRR